MEKPLKFWNTMTEVERAEAMAEIERKNVISKANPVVPAPDYPKTTYAGD
jgi:hypothetical protein